MAEKDTQRPAGANKYSLYAGREEAVNWGKIAADLTGNLNKIKISRDAAKKEINENTDKALTELSEISDVQSGDMNGLLIDGSDFSKNTLTANMDLVRRGLLDPKDYMLIMQKQKDGYKRLSNYAKNFDAKYKIGMEQVQSGAASNLQEYFQTTGFSFGNTKNKKLWSDPATGELILVQMVDDGTGKFVMPNRNDNPENFATPAQMLQMVDFTEKSQNLNEDVKNLVTNNLAEVVSSTMTSYNVLSGGKDIKSIEDFRQLFGDVGGLKDENGKKLTFEGWMDIQADGILSDDNTSAEYLMNSNSKYKFTNDKAAAAKDPNLIYANTDGGQPVVELTDEQKKIARNLATNQINTQLDFIVKEKAGLGGAQESSSNQNEKLIDKNIDGYLRDLNVVLTDPDSAKAESQLLRLVQDRNEANVTAGNPLITDVDITDDVIIVSFDGREPIRITRTEYDDQGVQSSQTGLGSDMAQLYSVLSPYGQDKGYDLSTSQVESRIRDNKITLGDRGSGRNVGFEESFNPGEENFTSDTLTGPKGGEITLADWFKDKGDMGDTTSMVSDKKIKKRMNAALGVFFTGDMKANFSDAGFQNPTIIVEDVRKQEPGASKATYRKSVSFITYKDADGKDVKIEIGSVVSGTTMAELGDRVANAISDMNKKANATLKAGGGSGQTFEMSWPAYKKKFPTKTYQDYKKEVLKL